MNLHNLLKVGAAALLLAIPLGACGKLGRLQTPGPLTGSGEASHDAKDPQQPITTVDPRDRIDTDPAPPRAVPLEGVGQDPWKAGPPGSLPDPYTNPR
jgi:hypothetical protein